MDSKQIQDIADEGARRSLASAIEERIHRTKPEVFAGYRSNGEFIDLPQKIEKARKNLDEIETIYAELVKRSNDHG